MELIFLLCKFIYNLFRSKEELEAENIALHQQLWVYKRRQKKKPILNEGDRFIWSLLSQVWDKWQDCLVIVKPATVINWQKRTFRQYWTWKCRPKGRPGRPKTPPDIRKLIVTIAKANPSWGAPRVHGKLRALGVDISESTVSSLMPKRDKPPSQTWPTFIKNHIGGLKRLVCSDFFTVPTMTFNILYCFVILDLDRRKIVSFGVTKHPTAQWTANIFKEAFPWNTAPGYLLHDRDCIYGKKFSEVVKSMGVKEVLTAPRRPTMNAFAERVMGSIRREALDHHIIMDEWHLRQVMQQYVDYYHEDRTHLALDKATPYEREVQERPQGDAVLVEEPRLGGLHHRYYWQEAA